MTIDQNIIPMYNLYPCPKLVSYISETTWRRPGPRSTPSPGTSTTRSRQTRQFYVVVVYHVTIVAIGHGLLRNFGLWYQAAFYALQGVQLFEPMQTRLLRWNYSIITSPWPWVVAGFVFNVMTPPKTVFFICRMALTHQMNLFKRMPFTVF